MSTVEPMADPQDAVEVPSSVDARTLQILERRRTSALRMRRGWLVCPCSCLRTSSGSRSPSSPRRSSSSRPLRSDAVASQVELLVFCLSLPAWVVVAKLYGLYDFDEERTDHSTADGLVGVGHVRKRLPDTS